VDQNELEVCDGGPGFERPPSPAPRNAGGGFGLVIVDRVATRWGVWKPTHPITSAAEPAAMRASCSLSG
jgi:hypothetical protein